MNFIHFLGLDFLSGEKGEKGDKGDRGEAGGTVPLSTIIDTIYPVGCYFETTDTTFNPNTTWGGTWELETEGLVHISSGTNYAVSTSARDGGSSSISYTPAGNNTGGKVNSHTLTTTELPKMSGSAYFRRTSGNGDICFSASGVFSRATLGSSNTSYNQIASSTSTYRDQLNFNVGGGGGHDHGFTQPTFSGTQATLNVMQPYKIVNRWHRTA